MVFTPNSVLTASQLNTHLRDNLLELAPAKTSQSGSIVMGAGYNKLAERIPVSARVAAVESVQKTEFSNLVTAGPKVVAKTGTRALVFIAAACGSAGIRQACIMGYDITGATRREASDDRSLYIEGLHAAKDNRWCHIVLEEDLKPGLNTFTCKYKAGTTDFTSTFHDRFICVWPI